MVVVFCSVEWQKKSKRFLELNFSWLAAFRSRPKTNFKILESFFGLRQWTSSRCLHLSKADAQVSITDSQLSSKSALSKIFSRFVSQVNLHSENNGKQQCTFFTTYFSTIYQPFAPAWLMFCHRARDHKIIGLRPRNKNKTSKIWTSRWFSACHKICGLCILKLNLSGTSIALNFNGPKRIESYKNKLDVACNQILADEACQGQEWVFQGHTGFQGHIQ